MDYLEQQEYHGDIIKAQYKINENDIYVVTYSKLTGEWKVYLDKKMLCKSRDFNKIYDKIPEGSR